jgi:hypothetical protein
MMLLFALISYIPTAIQIEQKIGTVRMIYRFFSLGILSELVFTLICIGFGIKQIGLGLWPLLFVDLVIQCMS